MDGPHAVAIVAAILQVRNAVEQAGAEEQRARGAIQHVPVFRDTIEEALELIDRANEVTSLPPPPR